MLLKSAVLLFSFITVCIKGNHAYAVPKAENVIKVNSSAHIESSTRYSFILLGATGDLSKRKIYPALWSLYQNNLLPNNLRIFGYGRKQMKVELLRKNVEPYVTVNSTEKKLYDKFWQLTSYVRGTDGGLSDYQVLNNAVEAYEKGLKSNRIFYLALPPSVFASATSNIKAAAMAKHGLTRVVIEKPFGYDFESSQKLSEHLASVLTEDQIYRIDHYLGYEMVQNLFALRFGNRMFEPILNKENVAAVKVNFAEEIGVQGSGSYFDSVGIIRDVMQNHLLQVMSIVAMEKPNSNRADDIRDAKVKLLTDTQAINDANDVVLGQYVVNPASNDFEAKVGYRGERTVPDDSVTPTFAETVLRVKNQRWEGVPFIIRAGKALNQNQTQIIIQLKNANNALFETQPKRNELVINLKNPQSLQVKLTSKITGYSNNLEDITVDYNYDKGNRSAVAPKPYERLLLDVFKGCQVNFVRTDELREAWRIFTPIFNEIDTKQIPLVEYKYGSAGPAEADELEQKNNFLR
ncbi:glucose-6-phosphate 1-dehydrogenase-like [Phymastichus coffea]|uniref:glucose-6-phosphate 1-dehydrogenase-like n=1 Tax=Phymastichus coffea TaxID=108790 RepID=UPI00273CF450|nr:glucose-6-phosphate 1-dehydrogenase-like [Phymastichus coffea]